MCHWCEPKPKPEPEPEPAVETVTLGNSRYRLDAAVSGDTMTVILWDRRFMRAVINISLEGSDK